jgi:hypothetical protein
MDGAKQTVLAEVIMKRVGERVDAITQDYIRHSIREVRMSRIWRRILGLTGLIGLLLPSVALAAGGGPVAPLVIVADTRKLSGIQLFWASLYNESHLYFTILTIVLIPLIGLAFGFLADLIMGHIGIDLKSRELAEH